MATEDINMIVMEMVLGNDVVLVCRYASDIDGAIKDALTAMRDHLCIMIPPPRRIYPVCFHAFIVAVSTRCKRLVTAYFADPTFKPWPARALEWSPKVVIMQEVYDTPYRWTTYLEEWEALQRSQEQEG